MTNRIAVQLQNPLQHVRLLEVPEDVFELLTSSKQNIHFKSHKDGFLHLVADEKSWLVKQVSTSNSVYITQSTDDAVTAFAKPSTVLEVYPVADKVVQQSIVEQVSQLVPTISSYAELKPISLRTVMSEISAPDVAIRRMLARQCVCEHLGQVFMPSPALLLETWKQMLDTATMTDATITMNLDVGRLLSHGTPLDDDADTHGVRITIAGRLFEKDGHFNALGLLDGGLWEENMARWVGNLILRAALDQGNPFQKNAFEKAWDEMVPRPWIKFCSVEMLDGACEVSNDDGTEVVAWKPFCLARETPPETSQGGGSSSNAHNKKRKWHEKFAAQRAQK